MGFKVLRELPGEDELKSALPVPFKAALTKEKCDRELRSAVCGADDRFIVLIGPCSADSEAAVRDYCGRLSAVRDKLSERLIIIPRVFTTKARTKGTGYMGMLHSGDMSAALYEIRRLYAGILEDYGFAPAYDLLYPEVFGYIDDLAGYVMVGARSVENQQHRLAASGVDVPVGMKNPMSGNISVMLNAIYAAQFPQRLILGRRELKTAGNPLAHGVLRGYINFCGENIPNYQIADLERITGEYESAGLCNPLLIVDTNHSNSGKSYGKQGEIALDVLESRKKCPAIRKMVRGLLIESYIESGNQDENGGVYGKSITDGCISWTETEGLLYKIAEEV